MNPRRRFWVETALAGLSALFFLLTVLWKDWIEVVSGVDPDHHSGSLEWGIAIVALLIAIGFAAAARTELRHHRAAIAPH
jgi:hypothetical protein